MTGLTLQINCNHLRLLLGYTLVSLYPKNEKPIKLVQEFKYLGSWVDNSSKDLKTRKAQVWTAARKLDNIWKSNLNREIKTSFFRATVENILLHGSEAWTTTSKINDEIDGVYTRFLRHALNIHWRQHITNIKLYGDLKKASELVRYRSAEVAADLVLWKPTYGHRSQGRPQLNFVTLLSRDTGLHPEDLRNAMLADLPVQKWPKFLGF